MNNQKPEPHVKGEGNLLDLHSMFLTIQGEGPFAGHRAVFIRLAGCNLQCPGCDTEYTDGRAQSSVDYILSRVHKLTPHRAHLPYLGLVVITGGEPLRQPIGRLVDNLLNEGYSVQIESNGMFAPDPVLAGLFYTRKKEVLCLVVSPKTPKINQETAAYAHAFKYVLDAKSVSLIDGLPVHALENNVGGQVARPPTGIPVYLSPYDEDQKLPNARNLDAVVQSSLTHGYIAGVQLHKLMNLA